MNLPSQLNASSQTNSLFGKALSAPLLSSHDAGWNGIHLEYYREPAGEQPEHFFEHCHVLCIEVSDRPCSARKWMNGESEAKPIVHGDVFIIPEYIRYREQWDGDIEFISLAILSNFVAQIADELVSSPTIEILPHFPKPDPLIYQIGVALKCALETDGLASLLYAETMATALVAHLLRYYSAHRSTYPRAIAHPTAGISKSSLSKSTLKRVTDYIMDHLDQELSLTELAALAQMSRHHFARLFKQSVGVSPHQYVIQQRVNRAKQLLLHGELSVADVAYQVGFANQSHLSRHFKRIVGVSPKQLQQYGNSLG
jgi:AraC family transcriptional regulator